MFVRILMENKFKRYFDTTIEPSDLMVCFLIWLGATAVCQTQFVVTCSKL